MARPKTKIELVEAAKESFSRLQLAIGNLSHKALNTPFDFSDDASKKEAHWQRDKNVRDVLIHLHEWHKLLLNWVAVNRAGNSAPFLPKPYNWKTYGELNTWFWQQHQDTSFGAAKQLLRASHEDVLECINIFSNEALFTKKYFDWTGTTSLGSYCISATSSHYDWAIKKLRAHIKKVG